MIPQNVTFLVDLFDYFRMIFDFCPYGKEGSLDLMAFQDFQQNWGCRRVWPVIKGQRDALCCRITPADGLDEKIEPQYRHAEKEDDEIRS